MLNEMRQSRCGSGGWGRSGFGAEGHAGGHWPAWLDQRSAIHDFLNDALVLGWAFGRVGGGLIFPVGRGHGV